MPMLLRYSTVLLTLALLYLGVGAFVSHAQVTITATTTLSISICGDSIVDVNEDCDAPGETGAYSTTIAGRQCTPQCLFGPYCGDPILQTIHGEECDDGNNISGDFCSATCQIEPPAAGGGSSSGGGGGSSGGSDEELGDTQVRIEGTAYPNTTLNILIDGSSVGSVRTGGDGEFTFTDDVNPGATSLGFWSNDNSGNRSITFTTTFDVTQGAVTTVSGIVLPPSIELSESEINPGDEVEISGQAVPNADIEVHFDDSALVEETTSDGGGNWSILFDSGQLSTAEHLVKARSVTGNPPLTTRSSFSSVLSLFVGVEGRATSNSDLNRDGSVNLVDFSILVFWWGTNGGNSSPPADINGNGNVGLEDFSILLFNWTG